MTRRTIGIAFLVLAGQAAAAEMDKPRLRQLATLPAVGVVANFGISTSTGFYFNDMKPDPLVEIARIRKELKDDASDAERYVRLGIFYSKADRQKDSEDAYAKAIALCRQQVKEHPDDMHGLAQLGDALVSNGEPKEAEPLLRRAVKQAPNDWLAWLALGDCLELRAIRAVLGNKCISLHFFHEKAMSPALFAKKPKAEQISAMRQLQQEAGRCYDRAIELAPRETRPHLRRLASIYCRAALDIGLRSVQGTPIKHAMAALLTPACAADTRQIARLSPNDPKAVGMAVFVEVLVCILHDKIDTPDMMGMGMMGMGMMGGMNGMGGMGGTCLPEPRKDTSLVDLLPNQSRDFARWGMERLEQLTKSDDNSTAADASEILANVLVVIYMLNDDDHRPEVLRKPAEKALPRFVEHLRRTVQLDPMRERAWDLLTLVLAEKNRKAEAIEAARRRIKTKDNAHNRFMLAKAYAEVDRFEDAANELRAGLKHDENDLNCRLGLIAVLLRRDDTQALKQAGEQLDAVDARLKQEKSKSRGRDYQLLRGLYFALSDCPDKAKELFQSVLRQDVDNTTAAKALVALGNSAMPIEESLAAAYFRARKSKIKRADTLPNGPIVGVRLIDDKITNDDLFFLSAFPQLRSLQLASNSITDAGLIHLKRLTTLRKLVVHCYKVTDKGLIHLKPLTNLRSLDLDCTKVTDAGLAQLVAFRNLESLSLPDCTDRWIDKRKQTITDVGLAYLRKLRKLRDVSLNQPLTDKGLAHLAALPHLRSLYARDRKITDEGMKSFEQCKELRELWLSGAEINGAGLIHLKGLRHLRELHLDKTNITDASLAHLEGLTNLEILELEDTPITDAGLVHLREMVRLRKLSLGNLFTRGGPMSFSNYDMKLLSSFPGQDSKPAKKPAKPRITDVGLKYLQGLTELEQLDLTGLQLTGSGLAYLSRSNNLKTLFISCNRLTDATLAHLEQFPRLEWLCLDGTNITDSGLTHLHKLKRLEFLSLRGTKVTDSGIAELRKVFPKLNISH